MWLDISKAKTDFAMGFRRWPYLVHMGSHTAGWCWVLAKRLSLNPRRYERHHLPLFEGRERRMFTSMDTCASWIGLTLFDASTFGFWDWRVAAVLFVPGSTWEWSASAEHCGTHYSSEYDGSDQLPRGRNLRLCPRRTREWRRPAVCLSRCSVGFDTTQPPTAVRPFHV